MFRRRVSLGAAQGRDPSRAAGQSVAEFALLVPVLLLLLLVGIDFGRVFLGWINVHTMVRDAANFAANNPQAWALPDDTTKQATRQRYQALIVQDASAINCVTPDPMPDPVFSGTQLGDTVDVSITCLFGVVTPIISNVVGNQIAVTASNTYPVTTGGTSGGLGGGTPPVDAPTASFTVSPSRGAAPLEVTFTDTSTNSPTSWIWDFGDGYSDLTRAPVHTYQVAGSYQVTLEACNAGGCAYAGPTTVTVVDPPTSGPVPQFSAVPRFGEFPLTVDLTDQSTGTITNWTWDFGDGTPPSTAQNPSHTYNNVGSFTVSLTVTENTTSNTETKTDYIIVTDSPCVVPDFAGVPSKGPSGAQAIWSGAGFTTLVNLEPNGNYVVQYQSLASGLVNPPGGCGASITLGP